MAVGCRRLAVLLRQNWSPCVYRLCQRTLACSLHESGVKQCAIRGPALCTPLSWTLSSLLPVTHQYSTNVVESEKMEEPPGFYTRLWRWIHTNDDEMEYQMGDEERRERDELIVKVQDMYFANPPEQPDLEFCKDAVRMLIKYNDRPGVDTVWNLLADMKIEPDDELTYMAVTFLKESRERDYD